MNTTPAITVFMPVYNGANFLREAIESVLHQTFKNFELLIVDDGSIDNSLEIIKSFNDDRLRILENPENKGLIFSRNLGIREAHGKYLAILDCDDIALTDRLQIQYDYLESNPKIAVCGGHAIIIDEYGKEKEFFQVPLTHKNMGILMLFRNTIVNSTAMIRVDILKEIGGYLNYEIGEDFDLFLRIAERYDITNIDYTLSKYRINTKGISTIKRSDMVIAEREIIQGMLERLGIKPDKKLIDIHHAIYTFQLKSYHIPDFMHLLEKLKSANKSLKKYDQHDFNTFLYNKWYDILRAKKSKSAIYYYFKSKLLYKPAVTFKHLRKLLKQSIGII